MQADHVIKMRVLSPPESEQPTSTLMGNRAEDNLFAQAIGREIYRLRKSQSMSGKELGARLNISQQQVSRYERAVCHITIDNLIVILAILGMPWEEFFKHVFRRVSENENIPLHYSTIISASSVLPKSDDKHDII